MFRCENVKILPYIYATLLWVSFHSFTEGSKDLDTKSSTNTEGAHNFNTEGYHDYITEGSKQF